MFKKSMFLGLALFAMYPVGVTSEIVPIDPLDQVLDVDFIEAEKKIERLSSELGDDAKLLLNDIEQANEAQNRFAILDGLCVASPTFVRMKRIKNADQADVVSQVAKEFAVKFIAAFPDAGLAIDLQEYLTSVFVSVVFLQQYADEYFDLVNLGLDASFLDTVFFKEIEEKAVLSRLILKKAADDIDFLRGKNFGQLNDFVHRLLDEAGKRLLLISTKDRVDSMSEVRLLQDVVENFFAKLSVVDQEIWKAFFDAVKDGLDKNTDFIRAVECITDSVEFSSFTPASTIIVLSFRQESPGEAEDTMYEEVVFSHKEKTLYTDLPVVRDSSLTVQNYVCGKIVRDENGVALGVEVGDTVTVKKLRDILPKDREFSREASMVKGFVFMPSTE